MIGLLRALSAEALKLRRSLMLWIALTAPFIVVLLVFIVEHADFSRRTGPLSRVNPWNAMGIALQMWVILMLPLFLTLEAALSAALEHSSKQWKHLFALPVPRWSIYLAKTLTLLALGAIAVFALWAGILAGGYLLWMLHPTVAAGPTGATEILRLGVLSYCAAWLVLAIQLWISIWWPSFSLGIGIGMLGTIAGLIITTTNWGRGYPWSLAMEVAGPRPEHPTEAVLIGIGGALLVTVFGCWMVSRRDVL